MEGKKNYQHVEKLHIAINVILMKVCIVVCVADRFTKFMHVEKRVYGIQFSIQTGTNYFYSFQLVNLLDHLAWYHVNLLYS